MREKQLLQDPGYVKGVESTCCMLHGTLQGCMKYPMSNESEEIKIAINSLISLMSKESKLLSIYNVDSISKYLN